MSSMVPGGSRIASRGAEEIVSIGFGCRPGGSTARLFLLKGYVSKLSRAVLQNSKSGKAWFAGLEEGTAVMGQVLGTYDFPI